MSGVAEIARGLRSLADQVEAESGFNNSLDVQCEIALFEPSETERSIRANAAGTKVIVTFHDGSERTYLARDFTISKAERERTAALLRAHLLNEAQP